MTRALLAALLATALVGCESKLQEPCQKACDRAFQLVEDAESPRIAVWRGFPEPLRDAAFAVHAKWLAELHAARNGFVPGCVKTCTQKAAAQVIACRRKSASIQAWRRCGSGP